MQNKAFHGKTSWNPVLNLVMEIKHRYMDTFGSIHYQQADEKTCLEVWIDSLGVEKYSDVFQYISITQLDTLVLIKYKGAVSIYGGDVSGDRFWEMHDGIYNECRSVVLDLEQEFLVLTPFKKFRNVNETEENKLENVIREIRSAKSVEITDKLDGSMQSARFVPEYGRIVMAGSQALDQSRSWRLADGYRMLLEEKGYRQMLEANPSFTFIFEYISLKDAHVVCYDESREGLYLIGARSVDTGVQLSYREIIALARQYQLPTTKLFDKTIEEVLHEVASCKSSEKEGFVLSIDGRMVKLKVDDYVNMHKILSNMGSVNLVIQHIAENTFDDLLAKVPQAHRGEMMQIAEIVFSYLRHMEATVDELFAAAPKADKKEFMLWCEENVDQKHIGYVRSKYLGRPYSFIKTGTAANPSYKRLSEMSGNEQDDESAIALEQE